MVHRARHAAREMARPGMTTLELDRIVYDTYTSAGGQGLFKWYPTYEPGKGFPGNTCISVNDEVVHGIPGDRVLKEGDIVSVDCGIRLGGYCGDAAITIADRQDRPGSRSGSARSPQETLALAITRDPPRPSMVGRRREDAGACREERHVLRAGVCRAWHRHPHARRPEGARTSFPTSSGNGVIFICSRE